MPLTCLVHLIVSRSQVLHTLWRRKGQVLRGDQGGSDKSEGERAKKKRGSTPEIADDDTVEAKTAYAIAVVRFIEACLGLLSVAPVRHPRLS